MGVSETPECADFVNGNLAVGEDTRVLGLGDSGGNDGDEGGMAVNASI